MLILHTFGNESEITPKKTTQSNKIIHIKIKTERK